MVIKFKYFLPSDLDIINDIDELNEMFPGFHFKNGKWDDKKGVFALSTLDKEGDFEAPIPSGEKKDALFFAPKMELSTEQKQSIFDSYEKKSDIKAAFELNSGIKLNIIPATEEPRKIVLSLIGEHSMNNNFTSEYGRFAYELDEKLANDEFVSQLDGLNLFLLGFAKSYSMPLDLFNWLDVFGDKDINPIFEICLGYQLLEKDKKKE